MGALWRCLGLFTLTLVSCELSLSDYISKYGDAMSTNEATAFLDSKGYNASGVVLEAQTSAEEVDRQSRAEVVDKLKKYLNGKMIAADKSRRKVVSKLRLARMRFRITRRNFRRIINLKYSCWIQNEKMEAFHLGKQQHFEKLLARNAKRQAEELAKFLVIKKALDKEIKTNMDSKDAYAWGLKNAVPNCDKMADSFMLLCDAGKVTVNRSLAAVDSMKVRKLLVLHMHRVEELDEDDDLDEGEGSNSNDDPVLHQLEESAGEDDDEIEEADVAVEDGLVDAADEDFVAEGAVSLLQKPGTEQPVVPAKYNPPTAFAKKKKWGAWRRALAIIRAIFRRRQARINERRGKESAGKKQAERNDKMRKAAEAKQKEMKESVRKFGEDLNKKKSAFECLWLGPASKNLNRLNLADPKHPCEKAAKKEAEKIFDSYKGKLSDGQLLEMFYGWVKRQFSDDQKNFLKRFGVAKNDTEQCKTTKETCATFKDDFELARKNFAAKEKHFRLQLSIAQFKYDKIKGRLLEEAKRLNLKLVFHKSKKVEHKNRWEECKAEWQKNKKLLADATKEWKRHENEESKIIRDKMKEYCGLMSTLNTVEKILKLAATVPCKQGPWNTVGTCSVTCGGGTQQLKRKTLQEPQNGGAPCGSSEKIVSCNTKSCPIDCKLGEWAPWGKCKRYGSMGKRHRVRTYTAPRYGGRACSFSEYNENQICTPPKPPLQWGARHGNSNHGRIWGHHTHHWRSFYHVRNRRYANSWNSLSQIATRFIKIFGRWNVNPCRNNCRHRFWAGIRHCDRRWSGGNFWTRAYRWIRRILCKRRVGRIYGHCLRRCRPCARENVAHYIGLPQGKFSLYRMYFRRPWGHPSRRMHRNCGAIWGGLNRVRYVHMLYPRRLWSWVESFSIPNWRLCSGNNAPCQCATGSFIGGLYTGTKNFNRDGWDDIKVFRCVTYTGAVDPASISCSWDSQAPRHSVYWAPWRQESNANVRGRRKQTWFAFRGFKTSGRQCRQGAHFMPMQCIKEILWCSMPKWSQ